MNNPLTWIRNEPIHHRRIRNIIGLRFPNTGYSWHTTCLTHKANVALIILQRYKKLLTHLKVHLHTAYIFSIIEYLPFPLLLILINSNILKLQIIQYKALRFAHNEKYPYTQSTEYLHMLSKVEALHTRLFDRATPILTKLQITNNSTLMKLKEQDHTRQHHWF